MATFLVMWWLCGVGFFFFPLLMVRQWVVLWVMLALTLLGPLNLVIGVVCAWFGWVGFWEKGE